MTPRFKIGTRYGPTGKNYVCTVTDILTTLNSKGMVVKITYVATHEFMGQTLTEHDVIETTIARGLLEEGTGPHSPACPAPALKALRFYADQNKWKDVETGIGCYPGDAVDYGQAAQAALAEMGAWR